MPERKRMRKESFKKQVEEQAIFNGLEILPPGNQQQVQTIYSEVQLNPVSLSPVDNNGEDMRNQLDHYIMVLEHPSLCEDLMDGMEHPGDTFSEDMVKIVMWSISQRHQAGQPADKPRNA